MLRKRDKELWEESIKNHMSTADVGFKKEKKALQEKLEDIERKHELEI